MKNFKILKPFILPILQLTIGLVLFWETAGIVLEIYFVASLPIIFLIADTRQSLIKNLVEIASISILLMIIGFLLPGAAKVLVIRYFGITILSIIFIYYMKKYTLISMIKEN